MDKRVLILGTLPPPVGGVTIHVKRLLAELVKEKYPYSYMDMRPEKKYQYLLNILKLCFSREQIIHYQLNNWSESLVLSLVFFIKRKKFISTIHSFPIKYDDLTPHKKIIIKVNKKFTGLFIAPSKTIETRLLEAGVKKNRIEILNTFLPPDEDELSEPLPDEIMKFVCDSKRKIILANAYKLYLNKKGEDIYGLDLCIRACNKLENTKFIFLCPIIDDNKYYDQCMEWIDKLKMKDRFLFFNQRISMVALLKYVDVFVRPTRSDSFGISVAEALTCGVPAVASDVCERAEGALIFRKNDLEDFVLKISTAMRENHESACAAKNINYLYELYKKIFE